MIYLELFLTFLKIGAFTFGGGYAMLPLVQAVGVDPVHFGIIMVVNLAIGFVTPPVGVNLYVAQSLSGVPVITLAKKALPYIVMFFIALMLITYIPAISLMLL